jgi:putative heme transporter
VRFLAGLRLRSRNAADGDGLRNAPDDPAVRDDGLADAAGPVPSESVPPGSGPPESGPPGSAPTPARPERSTEPGALARRIAVQAWGTIGLLLVAAAAIWALSWVTVVVVPLLIALFPAAALSPLRNRMVRAGWPRALAAFVLLFLTLGAIAALIAGPIPAVLNDLPALVGSLRAAATHLDQLLAGLGDSRIGGLNQLGAQVTSSLLGADPVASTVGVAMTAITVISGLLIAIISVFFLLYQGDRIGHGIVELTPPRRRADVRELGALLWATLGAYVRAQLIIGMLDAVFIGFGLWLLGVPLVVPLAALIFIGAQIPIVGAFLAGTVSVLVALAHGGIVVAAAALAVIVVVQFTEGHFLEPLLMSRLVRLPAFAVIVAVAMGSAALGILGALLAVPVTACAVHTVQFIRKRRVRPT